MRIEQNILTISDMYPRFINKFLAGSQPTTNQHRTYGVCTERGTKNRKLAEIICQVFRYLS